MPKFTKEQKQNIKQRKNTWERISLYVISYKTSYGYITETRNGIHYRYNCKTRKFDIPVDESKAEKRYDTHNYYEVLKNENKIKFSASNRITDYVGKYRLKIGNKCRSTSTLTWDTNTDSVLYIRTEKTPNGKTRTKEIRRMSLLEVIKGISYRFCDFITKEMWEKIFALGGIDIHIQAIDYTTKKGLQRKYRPMITKSLIDQIINRWNDKSQIKLSKEELLKIMMNLDEHEFEECDIRCKHPQSYGSINALKRIKNPERYIRRITKGYGKKIRKELCKNPKKAQFFNWVRKYEDNLHALQTYVEDDDAWMYHYINKTRIDAILKNAPTTELKNYAGKHMAIANHTQLRRLEDIIRMTEKIKTWNQEHPNKKYEYKLYNDTKKTEDEIITIYNKIIETPVEFKKYTIQYQNQSEWNMKIPHDSAELKTWGHLFHNCVGGYKDDIINGKSEIVTMWKEGKPKICIEVYPKMKTIVQAYKPCNEKLNKNEYEQLKSWATLNGLTTDLRYYPV